MDGEIVFGQLLRFTAVGGVGALLDWGIFNQLTGNRWRWGRVPASMVSTSCAMVWSFSANGFLVFHPLHSTPEVRIWRFLLVTCFSGWCLQSAVIRSVSVGLARLAWKPKVPWKFISFRRDVLERNAAKVAAIAVGYVWNFCWYRAWVYTG
jgi:putative flippase GtrA